MSETVTISTLSGNETFAAYVARPAKTPKAAILVIQEIFGVNAGIRRKCDKLAEEGYLAVAPDLFWRLEPGVEPPSDQRRSPVFFFSFFFTSSLRSNRRYDFPVVFSWV